MCQHDPTYQAENEANGGTGCPRCRSEHVTYGPHPAPSDYRIANRPNNPNWHGVAAWFDEIAPLPDQQKWSTDEEHDAEVKPGWSVNPVVTLELEAETISVFDAEMRRLCADYDPIEPDYPGMWK